MYADFFREKKKLSSSEKEDALNILRLFSRLTNLSSQKHDLLCEEDSSNKKHLGRLTSMYRSESPK